MQAMAGVPAPRFLKLSTGCLAHRAMDQESARKVRQAPANGNLKRKKPNR